MSKGWKIQNRDSIYFITFAVIEWINVFSRKIYKDEVIKSIQYCQENKGLELFAWLVHHDQSCPFVSQGKGRISSIRHLTRPEEIHQQYNHKTNR